MNSSETLTVVNGYKDESIMRLAALGTKLGKKVIVVIEKIAEIDLLISASKELGVQPIRERHQLAAELVPVLFRRELDVHQLSFAMGEALAHLNFLEAEGRAARLVGADGIHRFRKA